MALQRILVATDFSPAAVAAVDTAVDIARGSGAAITLFHSYEIPFNLLPDGTILPLDPRTVTEIEDSARQELERERRRVAEAGIAVDVALAEGAPADAVLTAARARQADLIALGTHGRRGLARLALGSVAETVLRRADCPVLTIRKE